MHLSIKAATIYIGAFGLKFSSVEVRARVDVSLQFCKSCTNSKTFVSLVENAYPSYDLHLCKIYDFSVYNHEMKCKLRTKIVLR